MSKIVRVSSNVFALISSNWGSNCYLIADQHPALIDSSLPVNASALTELFSAASLTSKDIEFVLHSHGHADHWGNSHLFPNAKQSMHEHDALYVNAHNSAFTYETLFQITSHLTISPFFSLNQLLDLGKLKLKVIFTPGHTQGSVCFYEPKEQFLFSGDTLFHNSIGRTDVISSDFSKLSQSIQSLSKLPVCVLLPGHQNIISGFQENEFNFKKIFEKFGLR